jgi:cytochrome c-type biogenesis protein CcmI
MSPYSGHEAAAAFGYERIMLIWISFAVMTGASVFALLWPLGRGRSLAFADVGDATSLYRAQLGEIDRDLARRLIGPVEAEAARAEAARRLLRASGDDAAPAGETESSLRRRRARPTAPGSIRRARGLADDRFYEAG